MKKVLFLIATIISCHSLAADEVNRRINTQTVGDIALNCPDAGPWTFSHSVAAVDGKELITISLESATESVPPRFNVSFTLPQKDMHHLWEVNGSARFRFSPDWAGALHSSLSAGMPLYQLFNDNDRNKLVFACDEVFRDVYARLSIREEGCVMLGTMSFFETPEAPMQKYSTTILLDSRDVFWADAVREAAEWIRSSAGCEPCPVPECAFDPLYSSWYQFHQSVFQDQIEAECSLAEPLGMKTIIIDDGWQTDDTNRGYAFCGDWKVSTRRFPQMKEHVQRVHDLGMRYMMWYSVPFIGYKSENFARFEGKYLRFDNALGAAVLDPRFPEVRKFLVDLYVSAMRELNLDGFKLDFIDSFYFDGQDPAIAQNYAGRDILTVPAAVDALMRGVRDALLVERPDVLLEFRQQYVGPAIAQFGNMFRVADCPGDLQANRIGICNLRLTSGPVAVHSDMIEWNLEESPLCAARAIISALFGVIQYSVMLRDVPAEHQAVIRNWLDFSQKHRSALLKGSFVPHHPEAGYPIVEAFDDREHIMAVYQEGIVADLPAGKTLYLINATGVDSMTVNAACSFRRVEAFDAFGKKVGSFKVRKGLSQIEVPQAGYIVLQ